MSDEEKKAIEQFKEVDLEDCSCEKCLYQETEACHGCLTMIKEILLNLIEKQDKELERYKRIANMNLKDSEEFNKNMCEHRCPIKSDYEEVKQNSENWQKIAEKLAERLGNVDSSNTEYCFGNCGVCEERKR